MNASPPTSPLVLYGALRSGTTVLRLILDMHPRISCPGERDFMLDALSPKPNGFELHREGLEESRIFLQSGLSLPEATDGKAAFDEMHAEDRKTNPGDRHVLVMHRRLDTLLDLHPDTRFIHLVRDPRDVARSSIGMGWAGNTWHGVDHWLDTETAWERHAGRLGEDRVFTLRYEDLVRSPEERLAELCSFVGVPYDPVMLNYADTSTYSPLDPKLAEQWRRKQGEEDISDVEHKVGPLLEARGYEPSGIPPRAPGGVRRLRLTLQSKLYGWTFRTKRFGFRDPLIEMISRRTGMRGIGRAARARLREKQKKFLK